MITVDGLIKRYGKKTAVDGVTFSVLPGRVTGFLGPNGSGKTTTMRCILNLAEPSAGSATVLGRRYRDLSRPLTKVGSLIDPRARHPGRTGRDHLRALAQSNGIGRKRVDEVIELVGLGSAARRRAGGFSLGMGQRLGLAAALLGDPPVLILDEPVNGLDPDGIVWIRQLIRSLAPEGRTILVSSHLMSEMQDTADHVIVIGRGRLLADQSMASMLTEVTGTLVKVVTPSAMDLAAALQRAGGAAVEIDSGTSLKVRGMTPAQIGDVAFDRRIRIHELVAVQNTLESAYLALTRDSVEYASDTDTDAAFAASSVRVNTPEVVS